ncbi:MAG: aminotransferase class V-fold PLP-dependent enzyme [Phycisphaerales bacterium]|nr:MAG: aminotransferase class V-fold PLP-dependent enzyme [Phycisphaerales bacterium]
MDVTDDFGPFDGRTWINCSHQGPLPRVAVEAAQDAVNMKITPHRMARSEVFTEVPLRLRETLGQLVGVHPDDIILGNSASYGLNVLANGVRWRDGDEILLVSEDFPATIFPWLPLRERGVRLRFIKPEGPRLDPTELESQITPATRLFCVTWVHSFTGYAIDETAIAQVCRRHNVMCVLNVSQGLGYRQMKPAEIGVDAISSCGFKWLCGPYGTGFCWIRPELRDTLVYTQGYWLANLTANDLRGDFAYEIRSDLGARAYDLFCTANFLNFMPWTKSVEFLLKCGIEKIEVHNHALASRLIDNVDRDRFEIHSPTGGPARSSIVVLRHRGEGQTKRCFEVLKDQAIDVSLRKGSLRASPHLYNTERDIDRLVDVLNAFGR